MQRHPIKESPRDGTAIILEDDASGTYDVAHWSTKADQWLGENGEPTKITPTHWYPLARDQYLLREDERSRKQSRRGRARRLAVSSITLTLVATVLVVTHFRAEVMAYVARYAGHEDRHITEQESRSASQGSGKSSFVAQQQVEVDQAGTAGEVQQAAQVQPIAAVAVAEAQQSLREGRATQEPEETRHAIDRLDAQQQAAAEAVQSTRSYEEDREKAAAVAIEAAAVRKELAVSSERQTLNEERARSAALASELEAAQREIKTQSARAQEVVVQEKQAAESIIAELRQSLQQEQKKTTALMQETKVTQAKKATAEPQRRALEEAQARAAALASELAGTQREIETRAAQSQKAVDEAAQQKQAAEATVAELRQSLQQEQKKTASLIQEAKTTMAAAAEPQRRALEEAQARTAALASELAETQREIETRAAQSQKAVDEAARQKQAAETTVAELRQSLQQEQKKTASLMQEAKAAQATMTAAEPQRRALEEAQARAAALASELAGTQREIETRTAQSQKAVDEAVQQKQAAEATVAELRQSLQQERDKTSAMARDLASMQRVVGERVAVGRSEDGNVVPVTRAANSEPPKAAVGLGNEEAAKLIALARALLNQGNIGAARIVLERASESGNAKASFILAETYDPAILSAWGTYGTRGEAAKAREYYAKAHAGGIQEAKGRLEAMDQ